MIANTETLKKIVSVEDLLGNTLREQQDLSAVEQYAQRHERNEVPLQSRYYSDLMPASPPGPGQQYAFEVDLDRCTACKACVVACHNLNGLEEKETWRNTGLLIGGTEEQPFQQTVTTACHHCADPACLNGCPVNAYEKDSITGIVKHLDDQCIGCKYCTLTCPYDVPKYSKSKGIVRKCDMCTSRLTAGEAPACVQACPNKAIRIHTVEVADVIERSEAGVFLPGAPPPGYTLPTTTYKTSKPLPANLLPADYHTVRKEDAHLPLVFMLVLTQLSVGTFLWDFLLKIFWSGAVAGLGQAFYSLGALALGVLALGASTAHLGRPQYAFRALLGLRRSWLSREILTFGLFAKCATLYSITFWAEGWRDVLPTGVGHLLVMPEVQQVAFGLTVLFGLLGIVSSVMVYAVTRRPLWRLPMTAFKFFSTSLVLGLSLTLLVSLWIVRGEGFDGVQSFMASSGKVMCLVIMVLTLTKVLQELALFLHLGDTLYSPYRRAAELMKGTLKKATALRFLTALLGGLVLPGLLVGAGFSATGLGLVALFSLLLLLLGELLERYLFFTTSVTLRMPGGPVV